MRTAFILVCLLGSFQTLTAQGSGFAVRGNTPAYVDCGPGMNDIDFPYTMEAWVWLDVLSSEPRAIWDSGVDPGGDYYGAWIVLSAAGKVTIAYGDGTGNMSTDRRSVFSTPAVPFGQWVHICGVQDGPLSGRIYFNGVQVPTGSSGTGALSITHFPTGNQTIGYHASISGGAWVNGTIDEVRIWDIARTTAQIRETMCERLSGAEPDLAAYWRMDEGTGSTVQDLSGNGHDGSFTGAMSWIQSGAPLGDISAYAYPGSWSGTAVTMPGPASMEQISVDNITSAAGEGLHVYRVDTLPNNIVGLPVGTPDHYYGVFATDITASYTTTARTLAPDCITCSLDWVSRNANDAGPWLPLPPGTASPTGCSRRLSGESSIDEGWRSEYAWADSLLGPYVGMGDTVETTLCLGDSILIGGSWISITSTLTDSLLNAEGCDSLAILAVVILDPPGDTLIDLTLCLGDSALLAGVWQTTPGTYLETALTADGCDSIVATLLSFLPSIVGPTIDLSICAGDSAFISGAWQFSSGTFTDIYTAAGACDSIVTTILDVLPAIAETTVELSLCAGDSIFLAGSWQNSAGSYAETFSAANGCDSLVTTTLYILPVSNDPPSSLVLCEGDSSFLAGNWQTTAGIYVDTFLSANGCDSLVAVSLNIEFCPDPPDTCILQLPNAFSPNADGINDVFGLPQDQCTLLGEMELILYNRWGEKIWWTNDPWQSWDGTYRGKQQELGTYVWVLRYDGDLPDNVIQQTGTVTLIR